ncbi:rhodanese-like domain-containing protein [Salipaludibacillus sp. CF4.18]|uniref:rhodanese-like domain-containing protein n=1 Tax=Salipaludibacillus sp. CF4.18 TaxID=3373081 RepID=UPI003EE5919E
MIRKYLLPILFFLAVIFVIVTEQSEDWKEIDQEEVLKAVDNDNVEFVDLREEKLYKEGHIPGALNIPYEVFQQRYDELNEEKTVLLVCHTGPMGVESAEFLVKKGFKDVVNFDGGMSMWNGPLEID